MRETRDKFMAPKMGLINEDGGEDFDATFKVNKAGGVKMSNDVNRYD